MKIKNLNFFEKHVEKLIIAVAVLFFVLVMWLFVLGKPYTVEITGRGGVQQLTPDQVETQIQEQARRLEGSINRKELPFEDISLPSWTEDFRDRLAGRFLPVDRFASPLSYAGLDQSLITNVVDANPQRVVPTPPAPTHVQVKADYAVLAQAPDQETENALVTLVGNLPQPRDFRYVSLAATFEMEKWRERLKDNQVPANQRIPEEWWRYRMYLTDVVLERQELDPATGQWGQTTIVPALPGYEPVFRNWQTRLSPAEVPSLVETIRDAQDSIARPEFVMLDRGMWTPPGSEQQLTEEQTQELMTILTRLEQLRKRQALLNKQAAAKAAAGAQTPQQPVRTPPPGRGGVPGDEFNDMPPEDMGAAPTRRPTPTTPRPSSTDNVTAETALATQIAELEARRDELLGIVRPAPATPSPNQPMFDDPEISMPPDMRPPGFGQNPNQPPRWNRRPSRTPGPANQPNTSRPNTETPAAAPTLPDVKIWAHDLTVKPGKTYRYRLIVSVLSPMYFINNVSREQYTQYYNRLSLESEATPWTEPVRIDPEVYFFLTGQDAMRRTATVDVMRIFNGLWMRQSFDVRAGDAIGSTVNLQAYDQTYPVNFNTNTMVIDLVFPVAPGVGAAPDMTQTRMLLMNLAADRIASRTVAGDTQSQTYQRVMREMQIRSAIVGHTDAAMMQP